MVAKAIVRVLCGVECVTLGEDRSESVGQNGAQLVLHERSA